MRYGIAIVAALGLVLGVLLFKPSSEAPPARTELPPAPATIAPDLPAPHLTTSATTAVVMPAENRQITNLIARILKGEEPDLRLDQLEIYLQANHRDAGSLLAAYQATHERALLDEAIAKFPNDPRVAYAQWFRTPVTADDPEGLKGRRQALDVLKQAAPDNALANYLSAQNYFKSGQPELAIQEMQVGAAKPKYDDYTQDAIQSMQEAYEAAGYSEAEAKLVASTGALLPNLAPLKQAGLSLVDLADSYRQAGDAASAQAALQMCLDLGQRLDDPNSMTLIQVLVGIAIQRKALDAFAAAAPDSQTGQAVQDQINALSQHREALRALSVAQPLEAWLQTASPQDVSAYFDRMRIFGEQRTMQWLANRNSNQ
jgi:hypothetical protein